jgi:hypothetical protein
MHEDLGHFGEERTLVEVCRKYLWHNRIEDVKNGYKVVLAMLNGEEGG